MRFARVFCADAGRVTAFLPSNYRVLGRDLQANIIVVGNDDHGWTLDGYVIPRLASGLIASKEFYPLDVPAEDLG